MESNLRDKILEWAKAQSDAMLFKHHGTVFTHRGHPDVYGHVAGVAVFFELKQPGKKLSPAQRVIGDRLRRSGAIFQRIDRFDAFLQVVEKLREKAQKNGP